MLPLKINRSYAVGFSPNGAKCFTLANDVNLWSVEMRKKLWRSHPFSHPSHAAFSPTGDMLAVKSTSGRIVTLASATGKVQRDFENDEEGEGSNLLFSTCGRFLASVQDGCIAQYCGDTGKRLAAFPLPFPSDVDYAPDARLIALGSWQAGEIRCLPATGEGTLVSAMRHKC